MILNKSKNDSNSGANKLINLISDIATKVVNARMKRVPRTWVAEVVTGSPAIAPNSVASLWLNGDQTSTPISMKNKTWETLSANQEVYIVSWTGSLSDATIKEAK
jgi:hypothetical protein